MTTTDTTTSSGVAHLPTGLTINYIERGDPHGVPVLFLHGWTDSSFSYSRLMPHLPARLRAIVIDQRGHGRSGPLDGKHSPDDFAADAVDFLDAIDVSRAAVVGHSMGSFVARRMAASYPDRVGSLVLIGTGLRVDGPGVQEVRDAVAQLTDPVPREFVHEFQAGTSHVPMPADFLERIVDESLRLPAHAWLAVLDGLLMSDDTARLAQITAPTLIVGGEQDIPFPIEGHVGVAAAIPGARLLTYPNIGHNAHWECPERFAQDLVAFLDES